MNAEELKYSLFTATKTESNRYLEVSRKSDNSFELETARQRFIVLYAIIEATGLEDEYDAWNEEE